MFVRQEWLGAVNKLLTLFNGCLACATARLRPIAPFHCSYLYLAIVATADRVKPMALHFNLTNPLQMNGLNSPY